MDQYTISRINQELNREYRAKRQKHLRIILTVIFVITFTITFILLFFGKSAVKELHKTAAKLQLDTTAHLISNNEIIIDTDVNDVWRVIANIDEWDTWNTNISDAHLGKGLFKNNYFNWENHYSMDSRLAIVVPGKTLAYSTAINVSILNIGRSIHIWKLEKISVDKTKVTINESLDGIAGKLSNPQEQNKYLGEWLIMLKDTAEKYKQVF